jgi:DNA-binding GntR family transcriptional regulator
MTKDDALPFRTSMQTQMTDLVNYLARQIEDHVRQNELAPGSRLPERSLAELFRVSRSPVKSALRLLEKTGAAEASKDGGFVVARRLKSRTKQKSVFSYQDNDESVYLSIGSDRMSGVLPKRVSENELMRRYDISRGRMMKLLRRISSEGWIERLPGHGWAFLPVLTSSAGYEQSFRFRLINEPAAILEPTFVVNEVELDRCRAQQADLISGDTLRRASPAYIFGINSHLHEVIATCSGNTFIIDGLRRINNLRRLMEYSRPTDPMLAKKFCREHIAIIDLLLSGKRIQAAAAMKLHLVMVAKRKLPTRDR